MDCWPERLNWPGLETPIAGQCSCDNSRRLFEKTKTLLHTLSDHSNPAIYLASNNRFLSSNRPHPIRPPSSHRRASLETDTHVGSIRESVEIP